MAGTDGARTRYLRLDKPAFYQVNYVPGGHLQV